MINDKVKRDSAIYLIVNKKNQVVAYTAVNMPEPKLIREDEDIELFNNMKKEGAACIADPTVNYVTGIGIKV